MDKISFNIGPGEILGFLYPNGTGKSRSVNIPTGLLSPQAGRVHILGNDVSRERAAVQARIGVCLEEKNLYLDMSGRENLLFFARRFGVRRPDVDGMLRKAGLAD